MDSLKGKQCGVGLKEMKPRYALRGIHRGNGAVGLADFKLKLHLHPYLPDGVV